MVNQTIEWRSILSDFNLSIDSWLLSVHCIGSPFQFFGGPWTLDIISVLKIILWNEIIFYDKHYFIYGPLANMLEFRMNFKCIEFVLKIPGNQSFTAKTQNLKMKIVIIKWISSISIKSTTNAGRLFGIRLNDNNN